MRGNIFESFVKLYFSTNKIHLCVYSSICATYMISKYQGCLIFVEVFKSWLRYNGLPNPFRVLHCIYSKTWLIHMNSRLNKKHSESVDLRQPYCEECATVWPCVKQTIKMFQNGQCYMSSISGKFHENTVICYPVILLANTTTPTTQKTRNCE